MRGLPVVVACATFSGMAVATTSHGPVSAYVPVELTPEERRAVEKLACQEPHRLTAAYAMGRSINTVDHSAMTIEVRCAPHARVLGHPVSHQSTCEKEGETLRCEPSRELLLASVRGAQWRLTVESVVMTMHEAFELALFVDVINPLPTLDGDGYADESTEVAKCDVRRLQGDEYGLWCQDRQWMHVEARRSPRGISFRQLDQVSGQ